MVLVRLPHLAQIVIITPQTGLSAKKMATYLELGDSHERSADDQIGVLSSSSSKGLQISASSFIVI